MKLEHLMFILSTSLVVGAIAQADSFFVEKAKIVNGGQANSEVTTLLINDKVNSIEGASTADSAKSADFILRPKVIRLGGAYLLSLEKIKDGKRVSVTEGKAKAIEDLDRAVDRATREAINGRPKGPPPPRTMGEARAHKPAPSEGAPQGAQDGPKPPPPGEDDSPAPGEQPAP